MKLKKYIFVFAIILINNILIFIKNFQLHCSPYAIMITYCINPVFYKLIKCEGDFFIKMILIQDRKFTENDS